MSEPTRMLAVSEAGSMNEIEMALAEPTHAKVTATRINGSNTRTFICAPSTLRANLYRIVRVCKRAFPVPTVILNGGGQLQAFVVTVLTTICKPMQSGSSRTCSYGWGIGGCGGDCAHGSAGRWSTWGETGTNVKGSWPALSTDLRQPSLNVGHPFLHPSD